MRPPPPTPLPVWAVWRCPQGCWLHSRLGGPVVPSTARRPAPGAATPGQPPGARSHSPASGAAARQSTQRGQVRAPPAHRGAPAPTPVPLARKPVTAATAGLAISGQARQGSPTSRRDRADTPTVPTESGADIKHLGLRTSAPQPSLGAAARDGGQVREPRTGSLPGSREREPLLGNLGTPAAGRPGRTPRTCAPHTNRWTHRRPRAPGLLPLAECLPRPRPPGAWRGPGVPHWGAHWSLGRRSQASSSPVRAPAHPATPTRKPQACTCCGSSEHSTLAGRRPRLLLEGRPAGLPGNPAARCAARTRGQSTAASEELCHAVGGKVQGTRPTHRPGVGPGSPHPEGPLLCPRSAADGQQATRSPLPTAGTWGSRGQMGTASPPAPPAGGPSGAQPRRLRGAPCRPRARRRAQFCGFREQSAGAPHLPG